jgi:hypothetical protein
VILRKINGDTIDGGRHKSPPGDPRWGAERNTRDRGRVMYDTAHTGAFFSISIAVCDH